MFDVELAKEAASDVYSKQIKCGPFFFNFVALIQNWCAKRKSCPLKGRLKICWVLVACEGVGKENFENSVC